MTYPLQTLSLQEAFDAEHALLSDVKEGRSAGGAMLWQAREICLVAPRAMERRLAPGFAASAARGWPCALRRTGGDVTPQGPSVLNLSLAFHQPQGPGDAISASYMRICQPILAALSRLGLPAETGAVAGSYCDGAFNVVSAGLKFAGTAQRMTPLRAPGGGWAALGHAMMLVDGDEAAFISAINALYADAGLEKRVKSGVTISLSGLGLRLDEFLAALRAEL